MARYTFDDNTVYYYGSPELEERTDLKSKYGQPQVYEEIKSDAESSGFIDPEFPHDGSSVGDVDKLLDTANPNTARMVANWRYRGWDGTAHWIRVKDLCNRIYGDSYTAVFNDGDFGTVAGRLDIQQGMTGDCWFVCSVAVVAMRQDLIFDSVPKDNAENDAGVYHFRFWYQGSWVDVVVDDYLPVYVVGDAYNITGSNFFVNESTRVAEYWPMLIEKAFAKLNSNYANIASNSPMVALEALTGGFGEYFNLEQSGAPAGLYEFIKKNLFGNTLVCGGTSRTAKGIQGGHAYSVTGVYTVSYDHWYYGQKTADLLRLRNPWGHTEWNGDWSDESPLWNSVSQEIKDIIGLSSKNEGEFWMAYEDFILYFSDVSLCFYFEMTEVLKSDARVNYHQELSAWSNADGTAGGINALENNPKFVVDVGMSKNSTTTGYFIPGVTLLEKIYKRMGSQEAIGIRAFEAGNAETFDARFFRTHTEVWPEDRTPYEVQVVAAKSFTLGFKVKPGRYVIVPCAMEEGYEARFNFRVLSSKAANG